MEEVIMDDIRTEIRDLKNFFDFEQISGNDDSLNRWIIVPDINRPGLELAGFYDHTEPKRVVILGIKEMAYINQMSREDQYERFHMITDGWTPCILISSGLSCPEILLEVAQDKNFPIFLSNLPTSQLMIDCISYLDEQLSPIENVHGVLVNLYGIGVLITGESGMGKSEIALELIRKGHILVSDDRVDVKRPHNQLIGYAPELLSGMLEIRGIGIMNVARMFGVASVMESSPIDFVIYLEKWDDSKEYVRAGIEDSPSYSLLGLEVPQLVFPVKEGRNLAMLVESAVIDFRLKQRGFNSAKEFDRRVYEFIEAKNKEAKIP